MTLRPLIAVAAGLCVTVASAAAVRTHRRATVVASAASLSKRQIRDLDIAYYMERAARDPIGALDRAKLASLYMQRARETGDYQDFVRAEHLARESAQLRGTRNAQGFSTLASSLLSQHRFTEALDAARELVASDSGVATSRSMLAEIEMELGMYDSARVHFGSIDKVTAGLSALTRLARWSEIGGRSEEAHRLLLAARDAALQRRDLPAEQLAWFHLRVGDFALRNGRLDEARDAFRAGLAVFPDDYRLYDAMAKLAAVQHHWTEAIRFGETGIAKQLDPATLGIIGDAYAALGDTAKAEEYFHTMEVAVIGQPGPYHRAWSLYLLDHDRRVPEVLAKAREELRTRRDIYGYDLVAWSLHKSGRDREAIVPMRIAMAQGIEDASLYYHSGLIQLALGDAAAARRSLERALAVNPYWHPTQPDAVRKLLASLPHATGA